MITHGTALPPPLLLAPDLDRVGALRRRVAVLAMLRIPFAGIIAAQSFPKGWRSPFAPSGFVKCQVLSKWQVLRAHHILQHTATGS
jgi:hypothetical protein